MFTEHISTAFTHIRRSPYQALAAILVMALTFFVASLIAFLTYGAQVTLHYFETSPQIIAFLKSSAPTEEISALQRKLAANPKVGGEVRFVSKEEALRIFEEVADNPLITELVPSSVLPASLEFSVSDLSFAQDLINSLKTEPIVDSVQFTGSLGGESEISLVVQNLERITNIIRAGGLALLSFLSLVVILILVVIIGMRIAVRREEIDTLRLIGATPGFIRAPFLLEGIIYGIIGAIVGFITSSLLLIYAIPYVKDYFGAVPVVPKTVNEILMLFGLLLGVELAMAVIIGIVGSFVALSRYLRI